MARSQNSFIKKLKAEKKKKKQAEKLQKKIDKKNNPKAGMDDMIAYIDEDGNITSEPPEEGENDNKDKNSNS